MLKKALCISLMIIPICNGTQKEIMLNHAFLHQGPFADHLDLTFSGKPICNLIPRDKTEGMQTLVYMLPFTTMKNEDEQKTMIEQLANNLRDKPYQCTLEQVTKPIKGVKCTITYDPTIIGVEYESHLQQRITFNLIYKEHLKKLADDQFNPIHRLALSTHQPHIMIDIGHGEHDKGAVNQQLGIEEKDINRAIGLKVASLLRQKGYKNVFLTRTHDTFVRLDERTTMANGHHADLFVSIHANSATNPSASGIETYHQPTSETTANRFHLSDQEADSYQKFILSKIEHSKELANHIHSHVLAQAQKMQPGVRDRGTKTAPFQVLGGTQMISALAELGFISNPDECKLLIQESYQRRLAWGICKGVISFVETVKGRHPTDQVTSGPAYVQAS